MANKKIVAFGGGSAMPSVVLPGLSNMGLDITTVTSMTDSGGSTGALRKEFNIHPAGDIRRHILALSKAEQWKKDLWKFRFANDIIFDDGHKGHNFGNVFMAGLEKNTSDFEKTLEITHEFMGVKGLCLPATMEKINIFAELENGEIVRGEDDIDVPKLDRDTKVRIAKIWLLPPATAYGKVLDAIKGADYIVIGPGDLYSSLLPCFLPKGIKEEIAMSKAKIIYICNLLAKPGESYKFTANDHAREILKYTGREKIDYFIVADQKIGEDFIKENPNFKDYSPVSIDSQELRASSLEIKYTNTTDATKGGEILKEIINN